MRLYLDQLILNVVAVARVPVAIPEVLRVVAGGCASGCLFSARFGASVCYRRHDVDGWKEGSWKRTLNSDKSAMGAQTKRRGVGEKVVGRS